MKKLLQELFSEETTNTSNGIDDVSSDDEIDQLFMQLEQITPPPELVENILASVARLPLPQLLSGGQDTGKLESASDGPIVRDARLQPS